MIVIHPSYDSPNPFPAYTAPSSPLQVCLRSPRALLSPPDTGGLHSLHSICLGLSVQTTQVPLQMEPQERGLPLVRRRTLLRTPGSMPGLTSLEGPERCLVARRTERTALSPALSCPLIPVPQNSLLCAQSHKDWQKLGAGGGGGFLFLEQGAGMVDTK